MDFVLDTNCAIEIVFNQKKADSLNRYFESRGRVYVPDLFFPEFGNVLWKMFSFGNVPIGEISDATKHVDSLYDEIISTKSIWVEAMYTAIETNLSVYDASYLFIAQINDCALMTLDKKLASTASKFGITVLI
ncbi:MAG: type II toxin-antitoxin system VapC family toxin [Bacteroidetes bacterium]|nr:type II toxin-antitoxin system VapC family toxin [Bacteroidota bacterium]